jgi:hypothetical protein
MTLSQLNTDSLVVEFTISVCPSSNESDFSKIKLKKGDYCHLHPAKFTYFYCYNCRTSICSVCFRGNDHRDHNVIEKYDYLQESSHLVELLFRDVADFLSDLKLEKRSDAEELRRKIKNVYFPELHDLLREIEKKQLDLIDSFLISCDSSLIILNKM